MDINKLKKIMNVENVETLDVVMYTEDSFVRCNCGTLDDFFRIKNPEDMAYSLIKEFEGSSLKQIKFGVIDE